MTTFSITQIVGAFLLLQMFYYKCFWVLAPLWSLSAELLVNLIAMIFFPISQKVRPLIILGVCIFIFGIYFSHVQQAEWNNIQSFSGIARAILGFYFGLWSRKLFNEDRLRWFKDKQFIEWLSIAFTLSAMWFLIIFSEYFFIVAALPYAFLVLTIARINESRIPIAVLKAAKYLGRISFQMYLWHPFVGYLDIGGYFARNLVNVSASTRHLLSGTITVAITIFLCEVCIRFFEKPLMKFGKHFL